MENDTMRCPYCGMEIKSTAKKCRYCEKWLSKGQSEQAQSMDVHQENQSLFSQKNDITRTIILVTLLLVVVLLIVYLIIDKSQVQKDDYEVPIEDNTNIEEIVEEVIEEVVEDDISPIENEWEY